MVSSLADQGGTEAEFLRQVIADPGLWQLDGRRVRQQPPASAAGTRRRRQMSRRRLAGQLAAPAFALVAVALVAVFVSAYRQRSSLSLQWLWTG